MTAQELPFEVRRSQRETILVEMLLGAKLTCVDILRLGCLNAKARIGELRKAGVDIQDEWIKVNGARVKRYFIPADCQRVTK